MGQLDPLVADALTTHPDVLLYAGGTNDLAAGPIPMLTGLTSRLHRYVRSACVVVAVPIFRYAPGSDAEVARRTAGTRILEQRIDQTGAHAVSYLDLAIAMGHAGADFWGDAGLGELHAAPDAYPRISAALASAVTACGTRSG